MESALTPREIQSRVRAGATLTEVAAAAGVPEDQVEAFAAPVFAERAHVAGTALASPVRRRGELGPHRSLRQVTEPSFTANGVDFEQVQWDAWRNEDRRWTVRASWSELDVERVADFVFDAGSRFSIASGQSARDLIGDRPAIVQAMNDPDSEPTIDLDDELALVRATQPSARQGRRPRPVVTAPEPAAAPVTAADTKPADTKPADTEPAADESGADESSGVSMEFAEVELEQVNGVYDFVPGSSQLDILYDMLSTINEDSVNIYEGLQSPAEPVTEDAGSGADDAEPVRQDDRAPVEVPEPEPAPEAIEPEQDPLVELSKPIPTRKPRRRHAAVPSWDEIMFGGPSAPKPKG